MSRGTCESKENSGGQKWKTVLFVVVKLHIQYEGQDKILNQIPKYGGLSEWYNSNKRSGKNYTEVRV